jgi:hypothetical protein
MWGARRPGLFKLGDASLCHLGIFRSRTPAGTDGTDELTVETTMKADLTPSQIKALQVDLENIDRAAHIVPMRRSSLFFDLMMHIDLTRTRLTSRIGTMQHGQAA